MIDSARNISLPDRGLLLHVGEQSSIATPASSAFFSLANTRDITISIVVILNKVEYI